MGVSIAHLGANTIADVIALNYTSFQTGSSIQLAGENSTNDGNGGDYVYDESSTATADGFNILKQSVKGDSDPGRWFRVDFNQVSITSRSLNTGFQPSTKRNTRVNYSVSIEVTSTLLGTNSGTVFIETSPDNSNWTTVSQVALQIAGVVSTVKNTYAITGYVKKDYYVRIRTASTGANTATFAFLTGEEMSI